MKRLFTIIAALILALSLLASCGGNGDSGSTASYGRQESGSSSPSPSPDAPADRADDPAGSQTSTASDGQSDGDARSGGDGDSDDGSGVDGDSGSDNNPGSDSDWMGERLSEAFADIMKSGNYYMRYMTEIEMDGEYIESKVELANKGDDFSLISSMEVDGELVTSKMVFMGEKMYMIYDEEEFVMVMDASAGDTESGQADYDNMQYLGNGTGDVKGRTLAYEEYSVDEGKVRYYFDGRNIYAMETIADGASLLMIIEEISDKIPSGMFDIPADYQVMDMGDLMGGLADLFGG